MMLPLSIFVLRLKIAARMKLVRITVVACLLVAATFSPVFADIFIEASISPDSLTVGDKFLYINRVRISPDRKIEPAPLPGQLGEATVISDIMELEDSPEGTISYACTLAVYKSGELLIPSFTFLVSDSTGIVEEVSGDSLDIEVRSVLPADTTGLDIADIREPHRLRGPIWPYLAVPLAVLLLAIGGYLLYRRLRGEPEIPSIPGRPPWEVAFEKLEVLKSDRHYEFGRQKHFYFELSTIMRGYIEDRYGFPALESTTYELENDGRLHAVGGKLYGRLIEFFYRADTAKFAKVIPAKKDADADLAFAFDLVRDTIPVIEETEHEKDIVAAAGRTDDQV